RRESRDEPRACPHRLPCRKDGAGRSREGQDRGQAQEAHRHCGHPEDAGAAFPQDHEIIPAGEGRSQQAADPTTHTPHVRTQGGRPMTPMIDYEDLIFQAKCQLEYVSDWFEEGGTLDRCEDNTLFMTLPDGSEASVYLDPIIDFVSAMKELR